MIYTILALVLGSSGLSFSELRVAAKDEPRPTVDIATVNEFHKRLARICLSSACEIVYKGRAGTPIRAKGLRAEIPKEADLIWEFQYYPAATRPNTYEILFLMRLQRVKTKHALAEVILGAETLYVELVAHPDAKLTADDFLPFMQSDAKPDKLTVKQLLLKLSEPR